MQASRLHASALVRSGGPGHGPLPDIRVSPSCCNINHEKQVTSFMKWWSVMMIHGSVAVVALCRMMMGL